MLPARSRARIVIVWLTSLTLILPTGGVPSDAPLTGGFTEEVDIRLLQLDVVVQDPKQADKPVSGLTLEQFRVQIDGQPLSEEQRAKLQFEQVCSSGESPLPVIAIVDLNFLDAKARGAVADEIEALAGGAGGGASLYKVYSLTRQTRLLTDGFTKDPRKLREAAQAIRDTTWIGEPGKTLTAGSSNPVRSLDSGASRGAELRAAADQKQNAQRLTQATNNFSSSGGCSG
jgi:hypothetical protein